MRSINSENHFGGPLPIEFQSSHEVSARRFMDMAEDYLERMYPNITFHSNFLTSIEIFQGLEAEKALRDWDSPEMDEYRNSDLKEQLLQQVEEGNKADIESAEQSRVGCTMLGDNEHELEEALKIISIFAAEKGGSLADFEIKKNIKAILHNIDPSGDWSSLAKQYTQTVQFIFS